MDSFFNNNYIGWWKMRKQWTIRVVWLLFRISFVESSFSECNWHMQGPIKAEPKQKQDGRTNEWTIKTIITHFQFGNSFLFCFLFSFRLLLHANIAQSSHHNHDSLNDILKMVLKNIKIRFNGYLKRLNNCSLSWVSSRRHGMMGIWCRLPSGTFFCSSTDHSR